MKASLLTMIVATMATALGAAETVNFDDMKAGMPPPGWTATQTGSGTAKWSFSTDHFAVPLPVCVAVQPGGGIPAFMSSKFTVSAAPRAVAMVATIMVKSDAFIVSYLI